MGRHREKPIAEEVQALMQLLGADTPADLAPLLGATPANVENWVKRGAVPERWVRVAHTAASSRFNDKNREVAASMDAAKMNRNPSTPMYSPPLEAASVVRTGDHGHLTFGAPREGEPLVEYQVVPRFYVRVSAGRGALPFDEEKRGTFAFDSAWMRKHLGRAGDGFASVEVRGDSMEPALLDGEEIIIDRRVNRVDVSGIYVIALRGDLLVKRVQRKLDGSLIVRGDNPAYEPETLTPEKAEDFRVMGRMVWPRVR